MKVLVLAGGYPQIALIKELHNRRITVVLCDYYENPVAKKYADIYYQVSTLDIEAITRVAIEEKVDYIITICTDQALVTMAVVSEKLGLPCYLDSNTVLKVTNKLYMKEEFVKHNIPTAKYIVAGELEILEEGKLSFPLIVKPADCNSSKGVCKVTNYEELQMAFKQACEFSRTDSAIIEDYIEGAELSVDVYVENGIAKVLDVTNSEKIADENKFVIFRTIHPANISDTVREKVSIVAQRIADAFCLKNCPMLIQLIVSGDEFSVLEFSARTGGGVKIDSIKRQTGIDIVKTTLDLMLGETPHIEIQNPEFKYTMDEYIYCYNGVYDHVTGFSEMKSEGLLTDYYIFKWKNAIFDGVQSSGDRIAGFTISANTIGSLISKHNEVVDRLGVIDINGTDIMRHDLLPKMC